MQKTILRFLYLFIKRDISDLFGRYLLCFCEALHFVLSGYNIFFLLLFFLREIEVWSIIKLVNFKLKTYRFGYLSFFLQNFFFVFFQNKTANLRFHSRTKVFSLIILVNVRSPNRSSQENASSITFSLENHNMPRSKTRGSANLLTLVNRN